jgi:hypothetical protein
VAGRALWGEYAATLRTRAPRATRRQPARRSHPHEPHAGPAQARHKQARRWNTKFQCWGSVTFWCGSAPLTNGSGSGSNSGSDLSSVTLRMQRKLIFSHIFCL